MYACMFYVFVLEYFPKEHIYIYIFWCSYVFLFFFFFIYFYYLEANYFKIL